MALIPLKQFITKPTSPTLDSFIRKAVPLTKPTIQPLTAFQKPSLVERLDTGLKATANVINKVRQPAAAFTQKILPQPKDERDAIRQGMINIGRKESPRYIDVTGSGAIKNVGKKIFGKVASEVKPTVVSKLVQALKEAKPIRKGAEAMYTAERAKRAAIGSDILAKNAGKAGFIKALGSLKGELPKPRYESPINKFTPQEVDELFDKIKPATNDFFDQINAYTGLSKILGPKAGAIPTDSELKLLQKIYGPELIQAVRSKRPVWDKVVEGTAEVLNVPRALMSSLDMSFPLRQGRIFATAYPKQWGGAFKEMHKYFGSEKIYKAAMEEIAQRPTASLMKQSKLSLTDITADAIGLGNKEEGFMTNLAAKFNLPTGPKGNRFEGGIGPGRLVKASERAYVGFANKIRADVFDLVSNEYIKSGVKPTEQPELFQQLAKFINNATGRGSLGPFNQAAPILNSVFFSPKLIASRFNMLLNPVFYAQQSPQVRKESAKAMVKFVTSGVALLGLAKLGGAQVEHDPRSTDFGKIKIGNTRYDTWAGFQQWVRLVSQLATGEAKSSNTGKIRELSEKEFPYTSRLDQTANFFVGKFAPIPSLIADLMRGQSMIGEPINATQEAYEKVVPLYITDIIEAIKDIGPKAVATVGLPAFYGTGTQTYKADPKTVEKKEEQTQKDRIRSTYEEWNRLISEGQGQEAQKILNNLSPEDYKLFKNVRAAERRKQSTKAFQNQSAGTNDYPGLSGALFEDGRKSGFSPIQGIQPQEVQHTAEQARIVEYARIDADPTLTAKQKQELKAKLQFDDLPQYHVTKI